jgi:hypothetical protein
MAVARRWWMWFDISPVFTDSVTVVSNTWPFFHNRVKQYVELSAFKPEEKMCSWRNDIQSLGIIYIDKISARLDFKYGCQVAGAHLGMHTKCHFSWIISKF